MKFSHRVAIGGVSVLLVIILLVAVQNTDVVELRFLGWSHATGVLQLVLASVGIGALAGAAATFILMVRQRSKT